MVTDVQVSNVLEKKSRSDRPWCGHWGLLNSYGRWWVKYIHRPSSAKGCGVAFLISRLDTLLSLYSDVKWISGSFRQKSCSRFLILLREEIRSSQDQILDAVLSIIIDFFPFLSIITDNFTFFFSLHLF